MGAPGAIWIPAFWASSVHDSSLFALSSGPARVNDTLVHVGMPLFAAAEDTKVGGIGPRRHADVASRAVIVAKRREVVTIGDGDWRWTKAVSSEHPYCGFSAEPAADPAADPCATDFHPDHHSGAHEEGAKQIAHAGARAVAARRVHDRSREDRPATGEQKPDRERIIAAALRVREGARFRSNATSR